MRTFEVNKGRGVVEVIEVGDELAEMIEDARDTEWQRRLMPLHEGFDGDGCDSGDPIDWSIAALGQKAVAAENADFDRRRGTVAENLVIQPVIEFAVRADWVQLRHAVGQRNPENRWRHYRAAAWSPWQPTPSVLLRKWLGRPSLLVDCADADKDPVTRWGTHPEAKEQS